MTFNGVTATVTEHVENSSGKFSVRLDDVQVTSAGEEFALGTPVRVRNVAQPGPRATLVLVAGRPIDPGWGQDDERYWSAPATQVWPSIVSQPGDSQNVRVLLRESAGDDR